MRRSLGHRGLPALRRWAAALLLLLTLLPAYLLLDTPGSGLAGARTLVLSRETAAYLWTGSVVLALAALLAARALGGGSLEAVSRGAADLLGRPRLHVFSAGSAAAAFLFAWLVSQRVLAGEPNLIDALAQLVHARYVAAGRLAGPVSELSAFWHLPGTVITPAGWVSQYPPVHVLLLALGFRVGGVELVGPTLFALTVYFLSLSAHRLFAGDLLVARLGTLLLAFSPFAAAHAAAYMNHTTAALLSVLAVYAALCFHQGAGWPAALAAGVAVGSLVATRPLTGIVVAAVLATAAGAAFRAGPRGPLGRGMAAAALGAAVPVGMLLLYNGHFFGNPFRFGYAAAFGPSVSLGFGTDPWLNTYGMREAIGYASAELVALSLYLLEIPLPLAALIALFLLVAPRLTGPVQLAAAWALLPVAANALYWHHGLHMGPRMLNDYAPAWCLLAAAAAVGLVRMAPAAPERLRGWSPRAFAIALFSAGWFFGLGYGVPRRFASYRQQPNPALVAAAGLQEPGLVFLHGTWGTRLAMQLAAGGMRQDSVEVAMRLNSGCEIQRWLDAGGQGSPLRFTPSGEPLRQVLVAPGSSIRVRPGEVPGPGCLLQATADRLGVAEVAWSLWRSGLPGLPGERPLFARDLGPAANLRLIRATGRRAFVLRLDPQTGRAALLPYEAAAAAIWAATAPPKAGTS